MRFIKRAFLTAAAMIGTVAACTVNVCAYPATAPNTGDIDNYVIFIVIGVVALLIIGAMVLIPIITGATAGAVTGAAVDSIFIISVFFSFLCKFYFVCAVYFVAVCGLSSCRALA